MNLLLSEQFMSCRIDWVEEGPTVHEDDGEDDSDEEYVPLISVSHNLLL